MASLQQVLQIVFEGVDNTSETAKNVAESMGELNDAVSDVSQPFADMAGAVAVVQAALLALGGVIGTLAYKEAVEFEASLIGLQKQMEDGEGSARDFAGVLEELALKYGINANELVASAADFKAAGFDLNTSTDLVEQSLKLVIAGGLDAAASVDVMNRALAGFVVPASDVTSAAQKIGDILNKTADITKSSFGELANGFADLSPIAKLTGLSFEETAALLSKVIDVFGSGSEAANGLKSGFLSIISPTAQAADELEKLGVKFNDAGKPIGTIKDLLAIIGPAFEKMDESQRLAAAGILFGKEQAARMVVVLGEYSGAMALAERITKEAAGSIEKEVGLRLKAAEQVIASTNEAWRQLLRALGDEIRVDTTGVISSLGALALSLKTVVESGKLDPLFDLLRGQLGELENTLRTVARNLPAALEGIDLSGLVRAFENLGVNARKALEALFGPIDLETVEGLRNAIQQVVDVLTGLVNLTAGELGGLAPYLAGIRELTRAFKDASPEAQTYAGTILGFMGGLSSASGVFEGINTALLGFIAFGPKLAAWGTSAAGAAAALAGPQGIAVVLGAATAAVIQFLIPAEDLADYAWPDWLAGYEGATPGTAAADIAEGFVALGNRIEGWLGIQEKADEVMSQRVPVGRYDGAISEIARYEAAITENRISYESYFNLLKDPVPVTRWDGMISRMDELAGNTARASVEVQNLIRSIPENELIVKGDFSFGDDDPIANLKKTWDENGNPVFSEIEKKTVKATGVFAEVKDKAKDAAAGLNELVASGKLTADQLIDVTKNANDFKAKMEEIASNERIKTIEATVSLNIARLETDAERVQAVFASIDTTIGSTGDLLGNLFGLLGDADTYTRMHIQDQIDLENKRRQEALDIQKKLAEAEIARIEAQTRALERGDAIIRIDGTGLRPHLEAVMWEILKAIRVRANAEFSDYLLGVT